MIARVSTLFCVLSVSAVCAAQEPKPRLDAHGFPLPAGATARLGDLRYAQRGWISGVKLSPDGKVLATGGNPHRGDFQYGEWPAYSIYFWNAETGRVTREVPVGHGARPVAFSTDGKLLAVAYEYGLTVLNVETGKEHWPRGTQRPEPPDTVAVHFLDNDRLLAVRTNSGVQLWDVAKGTLARNWEATPVKENSLLTRVEGLKLEGWGMWPALSPSGKVMAWFVGIRAGKENWVSRGEVHAFDTLTGERKHAGPQLQGYLFGQGIALLDEGETVLLEATFKGADRFGRQDIGGSVALDAKTGKERFRIHTVVGRDAFATAPDPAPLPGERFHKVAPDGKSFYTWSTTESGYVRHDSATGKPLGPKLAGFDRSGYRVFDFTPDGKGTVIADFARWGRADLDLKPAATPGGSVQPFAGGRFLSNDRILYDGKVWDRSGMFIEANPNPRLRVYPPSRIGSGYPTSFDGSRRLIASNVERRVVVYDIEADRELCKLEGVFAADQYARHWPVFSNDGTRVLVPFVDGSDLLVNWYDAKTGRKLGSYHVPKADVFPSTFPLVSYGAASSPAAQWLSDDGSRFGYVTRDSRLALVDTATSKVVRTVGVAVPFVEKAEEKPPEVKPAPVGAEPRPMFHPGDRVPGQPAWGYWRSGSFIVARRILPPGTFPFGNQSEVEHRFLDPDTGATMRRFVLPNRHAEAFSRDGRFAFVRSGWDGIAVYETATGKPRGIIQTNAGSRPTIDVSPDGKTMTTGCADTSVLVWDLNRPFGGGPDLAPADALRNNADAYHRMLTTVDPGTAEPALWALVRAPEQTVKLLADRLKPAEKADAKLFDEPRLPDRALRDVRALEALERIGTPEAKKIVEAVAGGHADALLTREAKLALARWAAPADK